MTTLFKNATDTLKEVILGYFLVLFLSAGLFSYVEDKPYFDSVYWASATAMTVGYGDISPTTTMGRIIAMLLMHSVPLVVAPLIIVRLTSTLIENHNEFTDEEQREFYARLERIENKLNEKT